MRSGTTNIATQNTSFLQVCSTLRDNLRGYADEEGRLLPELKLCERLSASRGSVRKALDELRAGGYISTVKRRNYVTKSRRKPEIGILMDCYKSAPYLPETSVLVALLREMDNAGFHGRLLVPPDLKNIPSLVEQYNLEGLIWFEPPESSHAAIAEMAKRDNLSICCIIYNAELPGSSPIKTNYVTMDRSSLGKMRAQYFLSKGHRKVVSVTSGGSTEEAFGSEMAANGAKQLLKWRLDTPAQITESLQGLIEDEHISAISSVGGHRLETLFKTLAGMEDNRERDLDIVLPDTLETRRLMAFHPDVGVSKLLDFGMAHYGAEAMRMLVRQISEDNDQEPVFVKPSLVDPQDSVCLN